MIAGKQERVHGYVLILPLCTVLVLLTVYPFFHALLASLRSWNLADPASHRWVGLANYAAHFADLRFWNALKNTLFYAVAAVGIEFLLGFLVAWLLNREFRGRNLIRTLFILPMIATPAPIAMVWRQIFDPTLGLANYLLRLVHLPALSWTSDSSTALMSIVLVDVWQWTPFFVLTLSAGLASVPIEPIEAARIDGASNLKIIRHIIIPILKGLIVITLLFRIMDALRVYDLIYVLTEGGPGISTETVNYLAYLTSFRWLRMGRGTALAFILLILTLFTGSRLVKLGENR